jgi:hypothetical protein
MAENADARIKADDYAQHAGPEQADVGQRQRERQHAQDRSPDHVLSAESIANRTTDERAGADRSKEREQMQLRAADGNVEPVDQKEHEVARQARQVDVLREHQCQQHGQRLARPRVDGLRRHARRAGLRALASQRAYH